MAVPFVRVKHRVTGAVTELPESALRHLPAWERVDGPLPGKPKPAMPKPAQLAKANQKATEPAPPRQSAAPAASDEKE